MCILVLIKYNDTTLNQSAVRSIKSEASGGFAIADLSDLCLRRHLNRALSPAYARDACLIPENRPAGHGLNHFALPSSPNEWQMVLIASVKASSEASLNVSLCHSCCPVHSSTELGDENSGSARSSGITLGLRLWTAFS